MKRERRAKVLLNNRPTGKNIIADWEKTLLGCFIAIAFLMGFQVRALKVR